MVNMIEVALFPATFSI